MTELEMKIKLNSIIADNSEFTTWTISTPHLMMLVKQVIAEEREACAALVEAYIVPGIAREMARVIRSRSSEH